MLDFAQPRWRPLLAALLLIAPSVLAGPRLDVARTSLSTGPEGSELYLTVLDTPPSGGVLEARIVDPQDVVLAACEVPLAGRDDSQELICSVSALDRLKKDQASHLAWARLHWRLLAADGEPGSAQGIVPLAEIAPDAFTLEAVSGAEARPGDRAIVRLFAREAWSRQLLGGVNVRLSLENDDGDTLFSTSATTRADGAVLAQLQIPMDLLDDHISIVADGRRGAFQDDLEQDLYLDPGVQVSLVSDKPIYQPGQVVHLRMLALGPGSASLAGRTVTFTVSDEDNRVRLKTGAQLSNHGVAAVDWSIPEEAPFGAYDVDSSIATEGAGSPLGTSTGFGISRYTLPTVLVRAQANRPFYLPGEDGKLLVQVSTLTGEPLAGAAVVARKAADEVWSDLLLLGEEDDGVSDEAPPLWTGSTNAKGRCEIPVILGDVHDKLADDGWGRYRDLSIIVRAVDRATGRSGVGRGFLRATREPLHVFIRQGFTAEGLPVQLFASVFAADGMPISADLEIRAREDGVLLAAARTGPLGLTEVSIEPSEGHSRIAVSAVDDLGRRGTTEEWLWKNPLPAIQVTPDTVFRRPGENIPVTLTSSLDSVDVVVEASWEGLVLSRQAAHVSGGRARVDVPWDARMSGAVAITAYYNPAVPPAPAAPIEHALGDLGSGAATVIVPGAKTLSVNARAEPADAGPGETVALNLRATDETGRGVQATLGLVAVDTAVEALLAERGMDEGISWFLRETEYALRGWEESYAGIRPQDLLRVDPEHVPDGLETVAKMFFTTGPSPQWERTDPAAAVSALYSAPCQDTTAEALAVLTGFRDADHILPPDEAGVRRVLARAGVVPTSLIDPWGRPMVITVDVERDTRQVSLIGPGPDGRIGSEDDLSCGQVHHRWFERGGKAVLTAARRHFNTTGTWPVTRAQLLDALAELGTPQAVLTDPWGRPIRFDVEVRGADIHVTALSAGPDGSFAPNDRHQQWWRHTGDDVVAWEGDVRTFALARPWLETALLAWLGSGHAFPRTTTEVEESLHRAGVSPAWLSDPFGRPYFFACSKVTAYEDRVVTRASAAGEEIESVPVRGVEPRIEVWSVGKDGIARTGDEVRAGVLHGRKLMEEIAVATAENGPGLPPPIPSVGDIKVDDKHGAILAVVVDSEGQPLPGVTVRITGPETDAERVSNAQGFFAIRLEPGLYDLVLYLPGFERVSVAGVAVKAGESRKLEVTLTPQFSEEVVVSGEAPQIETTSSSSSSGQYVIDGANSSRGGPRPNQRPARPQPTFTPRVRGEFPETLLWLPEVLTGHDGLATVPMKLADAITTWKLQVVASTEDGRLATAEIPVVASLPLYLEMDLPMALTAGDKIRLPTVLRNFTDSPVSARITLRVGAGLDAGAEHAVAVGVRPADSTRKTFPVLAVSPQPSVAVEAAALTENGGDAVTRKTRILPLGRETTVTDGALLGGRTTFNVPVPAEVLPGTVQARLTVYPGLAVQLMDAMSGVLRRPAGCSEQITSAAWLSLLYLDLGASLDLDLPAKAAELARRQVAEAVRALGRIQTTEGGFPYWRGGRPDAVLSAHIVRFLGRARTKAELPDSGLDRALIWLASRIDTDGRLVGAAHPEAELQDIAFIARSLAEATPATPSAARQVPRAVTAVLDRLAPLVDAFDEPHLIASYALACDAAGQRAAAETARQRLVALTRSERGAVWWQVRRNTPLTGWGLPGRLETTAVATLALSQGKEEYRRLADGGVRYLLRHRDRHRVWYSTAATQAVAEVLQARSAEPAAARGKLLVNMAGQEFAEIALQAEGEVSSPITIDLTDLLSEANRSVVIEGGAGTTASAELVTSWYEPWGTASSDRAAGENLELSVRTGSLRAAVGEAVSCTVHVARVAERGAGMVVAEVGLPPGAEVNRGSLEEAFANSWGSYEIRPDRVVLYLWPTARGADVAFSFVPRIAGEVVATPSAAYDYYNPEARVTLAPKRFTFREWSD